MHEASALPYRPNYSIYINNTRDENRQTGKRLFESCSSLGITYTYIITKMYVDVCAVYTTVCVLCVGCVNYQWRDSVTLPILIHAT